MSTLGVDPMSAASPEMPTADATALQASIAKLGQLVPIVVWQGKVIDGRKRLAVCLALGIEPSTVTIPDGAAATDYAAALNLLRTHYTEGQRSMYGTKLATLRQGESVANASIKAFDKTPVKSPAQAAPITQTAAAKLVGVARASLQDAKRVRRDAIPAVAEAVERGAISLYAAKKIADVPKADQADVLARAVAAKGDGKRMKPGTVVARGGYRRRKVGKVLPRVLAALGHHADLLSEYLDEKPAVPSGPRAEWLESLRNVAKVVGQCQRWLKGEEKA